MLHKFVCLQISKKGFMPEVFLRFKYFSEKLTLYQKVRHFRGSHFSQHSILSTALRARYQVGLCEYLFLIVSNHVQCLLSYLLGRLNFTN